MVAKVPGPRPAGFLILAAGTLMASSSARSAPQTVAPGDAVPASRLLPSAVVRNALSVDVEDYFHVAAFERAIPRETWEQLEPRVVENTRKLLELFARHGARATFFVLGWVAERWPGLVGEIHAQGHELAAHGYDHRRVTTLSPQAFQADVRKAKRIIEDIAGVEVVGYRAPSYSIVTETMWATEILLEEGYRYDSSIFPIVHDRYGIPGSPRFPWMVSRRQGAVLWEFPISTVRVGRVNLPFVGGGYLRHFPLRFVRWGMRRLNDGEGQAAIIYIHPWEVDPAQPRQPVGPLARLRHYRNLGETEDRLGALLREFSFGPVREILGL